MTRVEFPKLEPDRHWLVTGGAGFIGSHLVEHLLLTGQRVRVVDNYATGKKANIEAVLALVGKECAGRLELLEGDIRDKSLCERALLGVDYVLHQAALGSVPRSFVAPLETHSANVSGFLTLLQSARELSERVGGERGSTLRSFVYASSSSVYGDHPELPKSEDNLGNVLSPYAASKRSDELYASAFQSVVPFPIVGLRYFNVFGPRQDPEGAYAAVIPRWIETLRKGEECVVFGDGETSRDFCFVENVVLANVLAATKANKRELAQVVNVAGGEKTSLTELHRIIVNNFVSLGLSPKEKVNHEAFREGDVRHSLADIERIQELYGYLPRVDVRDGIARTVRSFLE
ncbi:MAG: GDP-mannose 4,6-dehydratase [Bdellovibrionales bacterium]|nr:GDP-mannose 4,6-dehydratase [Bdellovibrionales bacterium]